MHDVLDAQWVYDNTKDGKEFGSRLKKLQYVLTNNM